jgi:hypothetical protein
MILVVALYAACLGYIAWDWCSLRRQGKQMVKAWEAHFAEVEAQRAATRAAWAPYYAAVKAQRLAKGGA